MLDLTKYQKDHTCRKRTCLLPVMVHVMVQYESWSCSEKQSFWLFSTASRSRKTFHKVHWDHRSRGNSRKTVKNRQADCFNLLKRITKLKCVNSKVKSVRSHPQRGCLNCPMAPCWSHHRNYLHPLSGITVLQKKCPYTRKLLTRESYWNEK